MVVRYMNGFDTLEDSGIFSRFDAYCNENSSVFSTSGRGGGGTLYIRENDWFKVAFDQTSDKVTFGCALRKFSSSFDSDVDYPLFIFLANGSTVLKLYLYNDKRIIIKRGDDTVIASVSAAFEFGPWFYLEVQVYLHDTEGYVEIRKDGNPNPILRVDGLDTSSTYKYVDTLQIGPGYSVGGNPCYFDDFYVLDDTGTKNNDFKGDVRIVPLYTISDASNTGFVASDGGGDLFTMVDDQKLNDYSTSIQASLSGSKAMFNMGPFAGSNDIHAISITVPANKSDGGVVAIGTVLESGTVPTETEGDEKYLATTTNRATAIYDVDPIDDVDWTTAKVNTIKAGVKIQS